MSAPTGRGVRRVFKPVINKNIFWLVVCLLIIFLPSCQVVEPVGTSTPIVPNQFAGEPSGTSSVGGEAVPSQTMGPVPTTPTYTIAPVISGSTNTSTPALTATSAPPVIFAAIGDYGSGNQDEADVAKLVLSWNPEFIITLGDNNYPDGSAQQIDRAIGQFYHAYIYPYMGSYGAGADVNRFFPSLGNHDLLTANGQPYYDYFTLPGNERYYDFTWGPLHLFALDNIETEPDGVGTSSIQASWLKAGLAASTSAWNIVYMHYPPYSSGRHGSTVWARWPFGEWGANAVLAGHDHTYERLEENGLTYFVNGVGGSGIYNFPQILEGSQVRYNRDYGAMRIEATTNYLSFEFINRSGELIDSYKIEK